jgi:hypothetical protein
MVGKKIAPAAIVALKNALPAVYWYKKDLRTFLSNTLRDPRILAGINWDDTKRDIAASVVDRLATNEDLYRDELLKLMLEVASMEDFGHLRVLEDGELKAGIAEQSVKSLKAQVWGHRELIEEAERVERRRDESKQRAKEITATQQKLSELSSVYSGLLGSSDRQGRGYKLEKLIRELFELFDLDPKASFKLLGEQVDGAFTFDTTDYLFEARWQEQRVSAADLNAFDGKVARKLDNTLGLFLSINGFSEDGVRAYTAGGQRRLVLMDGEDLMAILDARIPLTDLLLRKRRHASQTGNILLGVREILLGSAKAQV